MKVKVECHGSTFDVDVGEGTQTVKWLTMVASQRYHLLKPSGRARLRERDSGKRGFFVPKMVGVKHMNGIDRMDPNMKICEAVSGDATLVVELQEKVDVDALGAPEVNEFTKEAFHVGECSRRRFEGDERRRRREQEEKEAFDITTEFRVMETDVALKCGANAMSLSDIYDNMLDHLARDVEETIAMDDGGKRAVGECLDQIKELYEYFTGSLELSARMERAELAYLLHVCGCTNTKVAEGQQCVDFCYRNSGAGDDGLTFPQLVGALMIYTHWARQRSGAEGGAVSDSFGELVGEGILEKFLLTNQDEVTLTLNLGLTQGLDPQP